jgi:hypothetical protein
MVDWLGSLGHDWGSDYFPRGLSFTPENVLNKFIFQFFLTFIILSFLLTNSFIYFVKSNLCINLFLFYKGKAGVDWLGGFGRDGFS